MPLPLAGLIALAAGSKAVGAIGGAMQQNAQQKRAAREAEKDRQLTRDRDLQSLAGEENAADPFRHTLSQMNAAQAFDQIANTRPKTISLPGLNPKFMPKLGGGYQASDELRGAATAARTGVLSGQGQAPTMTNSANYGQTGVMNLIAALQAAGMLPPGAGMPQAAGTPPPAQGPNALRVAASRGTGPRVGTQPDDDRFALSF